MSKSEELFSLQLRASKFPVFVREYKFHPTRRWRFDFAWPDYKIAVEIEGGVWSGGRHTRGSGFTGDCEKYNEAALLKWFVFRFTTNMITNGEALAIIERVLHEV